MADVRNTGSCPPATSPPRRSSSRLASPDLSRRAAIAGLAAAAGLTTGGALAAPAGGQNKAGGKVAPRPRSDAYEVLEVGPDKKFRSLTFAGVFMNSADRWNNSYAGPERIAQMRFRIIISPGPPGYYINDAGTHSRRWKEPLGWPAYEGALYGPVVIEGEPGKIPPVLGTDGYGDGVLYYQKGLFCTGNFDATFRRLVFRDFRRKDGNGNYAGIRLGESYLQAPMASQVLIEDCEFSGCDNGIMGGSPGQAVTIRRSHFHHNGNGGGRTHNIYAGTLDQLFVEDLLSHDCTIGHLLKSRAAKTVIRNSRLLGGGGTESACLDLPDAGILDIDGLVCEKSPFSDAGWMIHYSGENQDGAGIGFHKVSNVKIRNMTLVAPPRLRRISSRVTGFANQSGDGEAESGKGSHLIPVDAQNVQAFGLTRASAGLPCRILTSPPVLDRRPPRIA